MELDGNSTNIWYQESDESDDVDIWWSINFLWYRQMTIKQNGHGFGAD